MYSNVTGGVIERVVVIGASRSYSCPFKHVGDAGIVSGARLRGSGMVQEGGEGAVAAARTRRSRGRLKGMGAASHSLDDVQVFVEGFSEVVEATGGQAV